MNPDFSNLAKLVRYYCLVSTSIAGSGHPTSSLSAADLMAVLMFGGFFKADLKNPDFPGNDRLIFSKGHASPLFYALYAVAGQNPHPGPLPEGEGGRKGSKLKRAIEPEELMTLRKFGSRLEGHPTMEFPYTEVPTGSLGQGLSVGVGMALNAKIDQLNYHTYVLLGDSEMAEGSNWEAMQAAAYYKLDNLIGILDVNRLGQRGETMYGHNTEIYQHKIAAFGWQTMVVDGHNFGDIASALTYALSDHTGKPTMIIAKTLKGKGISFLENQDGWHGKALSAEELKKALTELGEVDESLVGQVGKPEEGKFPISNFQFPNKPQNSNDKQTLGLNIKFTEYDLSKPVATRKAYGNALVNILDAYPNSVVLDAETSNSTYAEFVKKRFPQRFFEMFIAEQNMVGTALGLARRGKIPFVSTFAAFFSRAFDQIRMSQYAKANIKFCGSHAGVSIGEDGSSQMGLEELAMFRTLLNSVVLYPCDAVSTEKLVWEAVKHQGNVYIQTTRKDTPIIYGIKNQESGIKKKPSPSIPPPLGEGRVGVEHDFKIGGSCILRSSDNDVATVIGAGITVHEALAAYQELKKEGINIRVIDLYSIKPLDTATLQKAAQETKAIIIVEDSYPEGGIGEAIASVLSAKCLVLSLAVKKMPHSGKPDELLAYEEIDRNAIIKKVRALLNTD